MHPEFHCSANHAEALHMLHTALCYRWTPMGPPSCPKCGSARTQTVKLLCLSMTKSGSAIGVGVSDSGSVGVGGALTGSMTELARQFAPGPSPSAPAEYGCGGCLALLGLLLLITGLSAAGEGNYARRFARHYRSIGRAPTTATVTYKVGTVEPVCRLSFQHGAVGHPGPCRRLCRTACSSNSCRSSGYYQ